MKKDDEEKKNNQINNQREVLSQIKSDEQQEDQVNKEEQKENENKKKIQKGNLNLQEKQQMNLMQNDGEKEENLNISSQKVYENVIIFKNLQINMENTLKNYQEEQIGPNIYKYNVISFPNNDKIQEHSKLKIFCEERDIDGILQNKDKQVQLKKFSMKTPKTELNLIKTLLLSMNVGEESWFKIINLVDQNESTNKIENIKYYKIKIIEQQIVEKPLDLKALENRFLQFEKFRKDGNDLFNNNQFENAIKKYKKGINFMEAWPKIYEQDTQVQQKKKYYYHLFCSNLAQSYIMLKEYEKAIMILEDIIPQCRGNEFEIKSYYRIIVCFMKTRDFDKAERYLRDVKHVCLLNADQSQLFDWLENECKPLKKVKL